MVVTEGLKRQERPTGERGSLNLPWPDFDSSSSTVAPSFLPEKGKDQPRHRDASSFWQRDGSYSRPELISLVCWEEQGCYFCSQTRLTFAIDGTATHGRQPPTSDQPTFRL